MGMTCRVCAHKKRAEIDRALLAGEPLRDVAGRFGPSKTALARHKENHLPKALMEAKAAEESQYSDSLFDQLRLVNRETLAILKEARAGNAPMIALNAIDRVSKQVELQAKLLGQLDESTKIAIGIAVPQQTTLNVLEKLPDHVLIEIQKAFEAVHCGNSGQ
jgi:hypothetical protein